MSNNNERQLNDHFMSAEELFKTLMEDVPPSKNKVENDEDWSNEEKSKLGMKDAPGFAKDTSYAQKYRQENEEKMKQVS